MEIVLYPDPVLKRKAEKIPEIDAEVKELAAKMIETMHEGNGVGLAGPQVGISKQIIVVNPNPEEGEEDQVFINPCIIKRKGGELGSEGCLSLPEIYGTVKRSTWIKVTATLLSGEEVTFEAEDFWARVLQHEIDHLNGVLFITKIQPAEEVVIRGQLRELEKRSQVSSGS